MWSSTRAFRSQSSTRTSRARSAAGRGMRALAEAIEKEGFRVVGGIDYEDARRLVHVFNTESCWLISVDGAENDARRAGRSCEEVLEAKRAQERPPADLSVRRRHHRGDGAGQRCLRHANAFMRLFEDSPEFMARAIARAARELPRPAAAADVQGADGLHAARRLFLAHAGTRRRRRVPQEPGRAALLHLLRREHAAVGHLRLGRQPRLAPRPCRADRRGRAQRRADIRGGRDASSSSAARPRRTRSSGTGW